MSEGTGQRSGAQRVCSEQIPCDKPCAVCQTSPRMLSYREGHSPLRSLPGLFPLSLASSSYCHPPRLPRKLQAPKQRERLYRGTHRRSVGLEAGGRAELMDNQLQFAFLRVFYIKMTSTIFFFFLLLFFFFKEKEFSAIQWGRGLSKSMRFPLLGIHAANSVYSTGRDDPHYFPSLFVIFISQEVVFNLHGLQPSSFEMNHLLPPKELILVLYHLEQHWPWRQFAALITGFQIQDSNQTKHRYNKLYLLIFFIVPMHLGYWCG